MNVLGEYSFNNGKTVIKTRYKRLLQEVYQVIHQVDSKTCLTKKSREKTMPGKTLYSPIELNKRFKNLFEQKGWKKIKVKCDYPSQYYLNGYQPQVPYRAYREMDFIKENLGLEVQFGKYA